MEWNNGNDPEGGGALLLPIFPDDACTPQCGGLPNSNIPCEVSHFIQELVSKTKQNSKSSG